MLSRKEFLKEILSQGVRTLDILTGKDRDRLTEHEYPGQGFDLPLTELSPSLLSIEADQRGIRLQPASVDELRRIIYREMSLNGPQRPQTKT